jgi:hypothetical protein
MDESYGGRGLAAASIPPQCAHGGAAENGSPMESKADSARPGYEVRFEPGGTMHAERRSLTVGELVLANRNVSPT